MPTPLPKETLDEIRLLAGRFFTPREIAMMLGLDKTVFLTAIDTEDSPEYDAYNGGFLQAEMEYRQKVIDLANLGSSPAQTIVAKMIDTAKMKRNNR